MARIFRATITTQYLNQTLNNTFSYVAGGDVDPFLGAQALANGLGFADTAGDTLNLFGGAVGDAWQAFAPTNYVFSSISVRAPYEPMGFYDEPFPAATVGAKAAANALASFVCASLRSNRVRGDVRRSFKRFSGLTEIEVDGNVILDVSPGSLLADLADGCSEDFVGTAGSTNVQFSPATIKRQRVVDPDGNVSYELFPTEQEAVNASAIGLTFTPVAVISHQASRKFGRGI